MDGLAWPSEIPGGRGAAAQRNAKVGKDAAGLAGRYTSSSDNKKQAGVTTSPRLYCTRGGGVYFRLPVLSVLHAASEGRKQEGRRGACRSCQARHLRQQQLATAVSRAF
jgi:hypothetical protein